MKMLGDEIERHGYRIVRIDPTASLPMRSALPEADIVIIEAQPQREPVTAIVGFAAALPGGPGVLVIEYGLDPVDRILALEAGADDCVAASCAPREIVARIRAISRRRQIAVDPEQPSPLSLPSPLPSSDGDSISFSGWALDRAQRRLARGSEPGSSLPAAEFAILDVLLGRPRRVVSRELLLEMTAPATVPETRNLRAVDIQVSRLRKRFAIGGMEIIRTVRGRGYMILGEVSCD